MARRITAYLRSNVLGLIALFVALSAGAYAAGLPKNSVKSKQIKDGQVKSVDVADNGLTGTDIDESTLNVPAGPQGATGPQGPAGLPTGPAGGDLTGTYPNPTVAANAIGAAEIADNSVGPDELTQVPVFRGVLTTSPATSLNASTSFVVPLVDAFDPTDMHATAQSPDVVIARPGVYVITATVTINGTTTGGDVSKRLVLDGSTLLAVSQTTDADDDVTLSTIRELDAGDVITLEIQNQTTSAMSVFNTNTHLELAYLGRG